MEYVVLVKGKYLQMLSAYSIFKEDPEQVTEHFEQFNSDTYARLLKCSKWSMVLPGFSLKML